MATMRHLPAIAMLLFAAAVARAETLSPDLVDALRNGGHVLLFREFLAEPGDDADPEGLGPCDQQQPLSARGRGQAQAVRNAFTMRKLPVGRVVSSPYCRAIEGATIGFGPPQVDHALRLWQGGLDPAEKLRLGTMVTVMLATAPDYANTVVLTHDTKASLGIELAFGEAALLRPHSGDRFTVLATVKPGEWDPAATVADDAPRPEWIIAEYPVRAEPRGLGLAPDGALLVTFAEGAIWRLDPFTAELGRTGMRAARVEERPWVDGRTMGFAGTVWRVNAWGVLSVEHTTIPVPGGPSPPAQAAVSADRLWLSRPARKAVLLIRRP
jgi:hypothetical protein